MRTRSSLAALVVLSLSVATPVAAETGSGSGALSWDGRCVEIASNFSVPVAGVRPLVPDGFTLLGEDTGSAQLNVGIARCPRMVVDGAERPPAFAGFTAVWIEPYEGFGAQRYMLWLATSSRALHQGFRGLGLPSIHAQNMRMVTQPANAGVRAEGEVPRKGRRGGYGLVLDGSAAGLAPASADATYWHLGDRGLARLDFAVSFREATIGPAELRAEPGTNILGMTGSETTPGGALLADFDFEGDIELV